MDLEQLRAEWNRAAEKDKPEDAIKVLVQLERLEPKEARWSQRLGEAYRRTGHNKEAVDAFARAYQRYFDLGFLPRAIAMAKLVKSLDAERGDLLEKSMPKGGPGVPPPLPFGRPVGKAPPPLPAADALAPEAAAPTDPAAPAPTKTKPKAPPPPLPTKAAAKPPPLPPILTVEQPPPPSLMEVSVKMSLVTPMSRAPSKPAPLSRAADALEDEVRFDDAPDSSVEISLIDLEPSEVITIDVDDSDVSVRSETPPRAREPATLKDDGGTYAKMATFRLFAGLSRDALLALSDAAELVEFVPTAMIIVRDERAFALYAIVSGSVRVKVKGSPEIRLVEGDIFGEASLLDEGQRQADVRAETELMTLRINKSALDEVTKAHPEVEDALFDLLARRLITNLMHTSPLFAAFEPSVRLELAQKFEVRRAEAGTIIAERGRRSDGLYILLAGNVMAEPAPDKGPATRIARGTAFGHASLLGAAADVTVRAATEAVLLRMPAAGFASLAALYPPVLAHLSETASEPLPVSRREP